MSGAMPSRACCPPADMRLVITSSKTSTAPLRSAASRRACRNAASAGMQPPEPIIGSTRMQARSPACSSALARKSGSSTLPRTSHATATTLKPAMTALDGLVPWAETGIRQTLRRD